MCEPARARSITAGTARANHAGGTYRLPDGRLKAVCCSDFLRWVLPGELQLAAEGCPVRLTFTFHINIPDFGHHRREISRQDAFYSIIFGSDILRARGKSGSLSGSISGSGYPFFRIGISLQSLTDSSTVIIHDNVQRSDRRISHRGSFTSSLGDDNVQRSDRRISHRGSFASSLTSTHLRIFHVFDGVEPRARGAPRHLFGELQARCRGLTDPRAGHLVDLQGVAETTTG